MADCETSAVNGVGMYQTSHFQSDDDNGSNAEASNVEPRPLEISGTTDRSISQYDCTALQNHTTDDVSVGGTDCQEAPPVEKHVDRKFTKKLFIEAPIPIMNPWKKFSRSPYTAQDPCINSAHLQSPGESLVLDTVSATSLFNVWWYGSIHCWGHFSITCGGTVLGTLFHNMWLYGVGGTFS